MSSRARAPELVAPAGTLDKLRVAFHFGADAAYLGLKDFSLRAAAGNFGWEELEEGLGLARELGRKIYVTVNVQPFDSDLAAIDETLGRLAELGPDGVVVADPAVLELARRHRLRPHLSTQASVTNAGAARFWERNGAKRIVAARELSLEQLEELVPAAGCEIEAFVHGAVCIAYSGRCLLSLYWAGRDPRRGHCAQACRWPYKEIEDRRRPGEANPVEEDEHGTYFFDAKDLCALPLLHRLVATGVSALKIEGRTRSPHYVGVTVDVYRHALDRLASGDLEGFLEDRPRYLAELARPGGRAFSTHFLDGEALTPDAYDPTASCQDGRYDYVGRVEPADGRAELLLRVQNPIGPGTTLELRDRGLLTEPVTLDPLESPEGTTLDLARTGDVVLLPPTTKVGPGALARLAPAASTSPRR